jgi:hypothetical protein
VTDERDKRFINAIEQSLIDASEDDLRADVAESGGDFAQTAARVRETFARAKKDVQQRPLQAAREGYARAKEHRRSFALPQTPAERRALFERTIERHPELHVQFRDFAALTDADIASALHDLFDLGKIDE